MEVIYVVFIIAHLFLFVNMFYKYFSFLDKICAI